MKLAYIGRIGGQANKDFVCRITGDGLMAEMIR